MEYQERMMMGKRNISCEKIESNEKEAVNEIKKYRVLKKVDL